MKSTQLLYLFITQGLASIASPLCSHISFSINASAENIVFSVAPDPGNATAIHDFLASSLATGPPINGTTPISGDFTFNGIYCTPRSSKRSRNTLQVLVHGLTYNKSMWSGLGYSSLYDWQKFANSRGYYTLAIDRLGHGENFDSYDPLALHVLLRSARNGLLDGVGKFNRIAFIGHYSSTAMIPPNLIPNFQSAATIFRLFKNTPVGYLTVSSEKARTEAFYGGKFDRSLAQYDFKVEDTVSLGEYLTPGVQPVSTSYKGHVLVVSRDRDSIFCTAGSDTCAEILNKTGQDIFPKAEYDSFVAPDTGHCLTLHYSAPKVFKIVHDWLDNVFEL
ncbi:hypothetical protein LCI18_009071 [Fusarium solani-melongenae]|uniref:Uncharacterized protein n=1 Tax=Fusarium solani subsp. cucurbitae TaxID=2747967 RepID=A0ACD3ZBC1_FUSSC|nr:hypothetical protein LCI18_009071 [Fusarium solani-melongenae]